MFCVVFTKIITKTKRLKNPKWLCVQCRQLRIENDEGNIIDNQPEVFQQNKAVKSHLASNEESSLISNNNQVDVNVPTGIGNSPIVPSFSSNDNSNSA